MIGHDDWTRAVGRAKARKGEREQIQELQSLPPDEKYQGVVHMLAHKMASAYDSAFSDTGGDRMTVGMVAALEVVQDASTFLRQFDFSFPDQAAIVTDAHRLYNAAVALWDGDNIPDIKGKPSTVTEALEKIRPLEPVTIEGRVVVSKERQLKPGGDHNAIIRAR